MDQCAYCYDVEDEKKLLWQPLSLASNKLLEAHWENQDMYLRPQSVWTVTLLVRVRVEECKATCNLAEMRIGGSRLRRFCCWERAVGDRLVQSTGRFLGSSGGKSVDATFTNEF